jgi:hypothetical protein
MTLQVFCPGESTSTAIVFTSKSLAVLFALCILSLSYSGRWTRVVGGHSRHIA